jgi:hypothetical protein
MILRLGLLGSLLAACACAADGIPARGSAADYPAQVATGKLAIGAAYISPAQVKKIFGEDLDKHGYVVFEIGIFPIDETPLDVSADDFKLRQGKDPSITRAATPQMVAADVRPQKVHQPKLPSNVTVYNTETIGYETGPYGRGGVYTASSVGVGIGKPNAPPPPPPSSRGSQADLEQQLEAKSLPGAKTAKAVAGYVFFQKPPADKKADFELVYFGLDGQLSLKLSAVAR